MRKELKTACTHTHNLHTEYMETKSINRLYDRSKLNPGLTKTQELPIANWSIWDMEIDSPDTYNRPWRSGYYDAPCAGEHDNDKPTLTENPAITE